MEQIEETFWRHYTACEQARSMIWRGWRGTRTPPAGKRHQPGWAFPWHTRAACQACINELPALHGYPPGALTTYQQARLNCLARLICLARVVCLVGKSPLPGWQGTFVVILLRHSHHTSRQESCANSLFGGWEKKGGGKRCCYCLMCSWHGTGGRAAVGVHRALGLRVSRSGAPAASHLATMTSSEAILLIQISWQNCTSRRLQ
eukprot:1141460-Pelagomonas_calceolata.AAC.4